MTTRRDFIKNSTLASGALVTGMPSSLLAQLGSQSSSSPEMYLFSKALQFLDYKEMSVATKEMGFDGLDLTVRPKGHVLPENVTKDLPKATQAMQKQGLKTKLFCTSIKSAKDPIQYNVLKTASELGYKYFRTGWYKYDVSKDILAVVAQAKGELNTISLASKELNLEGSYHNHSGHYLGTGIWDIHNIFQEIYMGGLGAQYDIMHNVIEGGKNWEVGFNLIKPYINTLVLKDFIWEKKDGKWDRTYVPMGTGIVDFDKYFKMLIQHDINVPISLHVEYDLGGAEHGKVPTIAHDEVFMKIKKDLDYIKETWAKCIED